MLRQTPWAVADQMLISAANFAMYVFLARSLSKPAMGAFTLVHSALLFINSIQAGLITQPHNILGVTRHGAAYRTYTTSTAVSQAVLAAAGAILSALCWLGASWAGWADMAALLLAMTPAIVAWQAQEFSRRVLYTENRLPVAFATDVIGYGGQALAIALMWWRGTLTGPAALYAVAAASGAGAVLGLWRIRRSLSRRLDPAIFRENWHFGKWIAGGEIVGYWLSVHLLWYMVAAMVDRSAAAVLGVVHRVFGPSRVLADVFCTMLPIRFSRTLAARGPAALHRQLVLALALAVPSLGGYCLLAAIFARPLLHLFFGDQYPDSAPVLALYAGAMFLSYMAMVIATALRAMRLTRDVFMWQTVACVFSFPIAWALIRMWGVGGAVVAMILTCGATVMLFVWAYRRGRAQLASGQPVTSPAATPAVAAEPAAASGDASAALLARVLELFDRHGVPWCLTHGHETYPDRVPSDVDLTVPPGFAPAAVARLLHGNRAALGARIIQYIAADTHYFVLAGTADPDGPCLLRLDIGTSYELAGRTFYSAAEILRGRRRRGALWVAAPEVEFACIMLRRAVKLSLTDRHAQRLTELMAQDPAGCRDQLARFWGADEVRLIETAAATGDWEAVRRQLPVLRRRLLRRAAMRRPVATARNVLRLNWRRLVRWCRPRNGFHVVLLGPDGAGKSSIAAALMEDLAPAFMSVRKRSFPPALLNTGIGAPENAPHDIAPRSRLHSIVRAVCYWWGWCGLGHLWTVRADLARCALVVHDRHLLDTAVDPRRYRYAGPMWLLRAVSRLTPRPDMLFVLDAPPEVIRARKQDLDEKEVARQREDYWRLAARMRNGCVIDASEPLPAVVRRMEHLVLSALAARAARSLGLDGPSAHMAAVEQVLARLDDAAPWRQWRIRTLGHGDQGRAYLVAEDGGACDEIVVKVFAPDRPEVSDAAAGEYEALRWLSRTVDGAAVNGWRILTPRPLFACQRPYALGMTFVGGRSLNDVFHAGDVPPQDLDVLAGVVLEGLRKYWAACGQIYGDLDFNNVLCDPEARTVCFIDPGMPQRTYECAGVSRRWYPASRDLAYVLFDVATSVRLALLNPRAARLQREMVRAMLRRFTGAIAEPASRAEFLAEMLACCRVHLGRIDVSWSPAGLARRAIRLMAWRTIRRITAGEASS